MIPRHINTRLIYQGHVIRLITEELSYGGRRLVRETVQHPGAVVILPVLSDNRIVFVRQYRHAVRRYLLELPAGTRDHKGESPATTARRELEEETGWVAKRFKRLVTFYAAPGVLSEQMILYLATGLRHTKARPEPDECVEPVLLSLPQALAKLRSGHICDAKTIIGVLLLARPLLHPKRRGARDSRLALDNRLNYRVK